MNNFSNASYNVNATLQIEALERKIKQYADSLAKWGLSFIVEVDPDTFDLHVTANKPLGLKEKTVIINYNEILAYNVDRQTVIKSIADYISNELIVPTIIEEIAPNVNLAMDNIIKNSKNEK